MKVQLAKDGFPKVWPWLTEDDITKRAYARGEARCAVGWAMELGGTADMGADPYHSQEVVWSVQDKYTTATRRIIDMLHKEAGEKASLSLQYWNNEQASKAEVADALNAIGRKLGYSGNHDLP